MSRIIAAAMLFIPGIIGVYGIKLMRDAFFKDKFYQFPIGLILFLIGFGFIAGFIIHRDRKKGLVKKELFNKDNQTDKNDQS